jgi:hypothetical protein
MSKEIYTEIIKKVIEHTYPDELDDDTEQFKASCEIPGVPHVVPWILLRKIKSFDVASSITHKLYYRDCNGLVHLAYEQSKNSEHSFTGRGTCVSTVAHTNVIVSPEQIYYNAKENKKIMVLREENQKIKAELVESNNKLAKILNVILYKQI